MGVEKNSQLALPQILRWSFLATIKSNNHISVGFISKFILSVLNTTHVFNGHILIDHLDSRPTNVPVLTVANHASCFDDPGLWSILPSRHVFNMDNIRWSLAAHNICFTNRVMP